MERTATGQDFILFPVVGGAMERQKSRLSREKGGDFANAKYYSP